MKKIYTIKKALLVVAALFTCSMAFAQDLSETYETTTRPTKDLAIIGTSYTIAGTYNAGGGSKKAGTMPTNGFKMRTGNDGNRCVFTVNSPYTITGLEIEAISNDTGIDTEKPAIKAISVEVDGTAIEFTGGVFPASGANASDILKIENIQAKESIIITFDNSNVTKNKQLNAYYTVYYQEPAASEPTIALSPDTVHLIPGKSFQITPSIVPATFKEECIWYAGSIEAFMDNGGVSPENGIVELGENGLITAIGAGEIPVKLTWMNNPGVNEDTTIVVVTNFVPQEHKIAQHYDFTTMGDMELAIDGESFQIWNDGNDQCNGVQFCTIEGLEKLAFQSLKLESDSKSKGWKIVDGKGLFLTSGPRCAAIGGLKKGQYVEFYYTGLKFVSKDYTDPATTNKGFGPDAGAAKAVINESTGHALFQVKDKDGETENLMVGFEINRDDYVTSITVYEEEADPTAINEIEPKANFNEGATYNFMGIKVGADAKGLLIKDGKVFIAK